MHALPGEQHQPLATSPAHSALALQAPGDTHFTGPHLNRAAHLANQHQVPRAFQAVCALAVGDGLAVQAGHRHLVGAGLALAEREDSEASCVQGQASVRQVDLDL
jgi:hypothetical protein